VTARMSIDKGPAAMALAVTTAAALFGLVLLSAGPASAQEGDGGDLYRQNCAGCHQISGAGIIGTFPPLVGNEHVDDLDYVIASIIDGRTGPIDVNGTGYDGVMPSFGGSLTAGEIEAIALYVQNDLGSSTTATTLPPPAITPLPENAIIGEQMFLGQVPFENGGPACAACHAAGEHGDLAARDAGYGPDLTDSWGRLGGVDAVIEAVRAHPGDLAAVYEDDPLTVDEIGSVASFLENAPSGGRAGTFDDLVLIAAAVFVVLIAATAFIAANRKEREDGR